MKTLEISKSGSMRWYNDNELHRNDDLPAVIDNTGSMEWRKNGRYHRNEDIPAVIIRSGMVGLTVFYYKNNNLHRDGDMPAAIIRTGSMYWYKNSVKTRKYFPVVINILTGEDSYR